jgi:hypothetical protein
MRRAYADDTSGAAPGIGPGRQLGEEDEPASQSITYAVLHPTVDLLTDLLEAKDPGR